MAFLSTYLDIWKDITGTGCRKSNWSEMNNLGFKFELL